MRCGTQLATTFVYQFTTFDMHVMHMPSLHPQHCHDEGNSTQPQTSSCCVARTKHFVEKLRFKHLQLTV
jgi:hypothetical protein